MITFNKDDLKAYLQKKTGYVISAIQSVDNIPLIVSNGKDINFQGNEGSTMKVDAFCDAKKTTGFKDTSLKVFLFTETVDVSDFIKFIRSKKLHKINKNVI